MFNYILSSKYSNIINNKQDSSHHQNYIKFLLDIGMLEELILESKNIKYDFDVNKYYLNKNIVKFNEIEKLEDLCSYTLKNKFSYEIYNKFFDQIFPQHKPSTNTSEENLLFCYFLNLSIKYAYLQHDHAEKFVNFFARCAKVNLIRREHCFISITQYMLNSTNSFFMFQSGYSHQQIILNGIKSTQLLDNHIKRDIQAQFFRKIKACNPLNIEKPKKIAVCISGMYRGHEQSLKEIAENIVKPLNADVFMHTWDTQADWPGIGGTASFFRLFGHENEKKIPKKYHGVNNIFKIEERFPHLFNLIKTPISQNLDQEKIKAIFPNIHIKIESQNQFEEIYIKNNRYAKNTRYKNQLKMFYGIYQSFYMALQQSLEYDFIIRIRPDVSVETFNPKIFDNLENNLFYGLSENIVGPTDVEFVCSSQMALSFINFCKNIFSKGRLNPFEQMPDADSHRLILLWLIDNGYSLGDDVIKTKILDSRHFKAFKDLDKILAKDISNLSKAEFLEEADLIEFFAKIVE